MTADQLIAKYRQVMEHIAEDEGPGTDQGEAAAFVFANWHRFDPVSVAAVREARDTKRLSDTIFNQLGTRDPDEVGRWFSEARAALAEPIPQTREEGMSDYRNWPVGSVDFDARNPIWRRLWICLRYRRSWPETEFRHYSTLHGLSPSVAPKWAAGEDVSGGRFSDFEP